MRCAISAHACRTCLCLLKFAFRLCYVTLSFSLRKHRAWSEEPRVIRAQTAAQVRMFDLLCTNHIPWKQSHIRRSCNCCSATVYPKLINEFQWILTSTLKSSVEFRNLPFWSSLAPLNTKLIWLKHVSEKRSYLSRTKKIHVFTSRIRNSHYWAQWMTGIRNVCTKNIAQYICVVVLLSTMDGRDKKCVHQECCGIHLCCFIIGHNGWQG